jgi:hypothetical protein
MTITLDMILNVIKQGGITVAIVGLVYAVYALTTGKWVPRWVFDHEVEAKKKVEEDCKIFRQLAFRGTELAERTLQITMPPAEK